MFKPKTLLLIITLLFILGLLFFIKILFPEGNQPLKTSPLPTQLKTDFKVLTSNTPEVKISSVEPLKVSFNTPADNEALRIKITPEVGFLPTFDQSLTVLSIAPETTWGYDLIYTVVISKETKSKTGIKLGKDYEIKFKTLPYSGI